MSAKTEKKQSSKFKKGQSGNPKGRPAGSRNKATIACQNLLDGQAEAITLKAVELALGGDMTALKLCLERVVPTRKSSPVDVKIPSINSLQGLPAVTQAITDNVTSGELTPDEGQALISIVDKHMKAVEMVELESRITTLEGKTFEQNESDIDQEFL